MKVRYLYNNWHSILVVLFLLTGCAQEVRTSENFLNIGVTNKDIYNQCDKYYQRYILFMNTVYEDKDTKEKMAMLGRTFVAFSKSIGKNNLAIWAGESSANRYTLNIALGKKIADDMKLSYDGGPYLIYTTRNPLCESISSDDIILIVPFNKINTDRIIYILNEVELNIRQGQPVSRFAPYKQVILSASDNSQDIQELISKLIDIFVNF